MKPVLLINEKLLLKLKYDLVIMYTQWLIAYDLFYLITVLIVF